MRIQNRHRLPNPPAARPASPRLEIHDLNNGGDEIRAGVAALVGIAAVGATAGLASGYVRNPIAKAALGSFAGASGGLTVANFVPKKPFLVLGLAGAVAGGVVAVKFQHPLATGLLMAAGATLPAGLILGLLDGLD